jgi:predicted MFS family arabinose efflux permease
MYPLGLFIGSPILGSLSDHFGRQKLIVGSLLCATVGYVISALALHYHHFFILLLSRFFTGFMEGNIGILRAAVADQTALNKHQAFGMIGTGTTLGYTVGPLLGAILSNSNIVSWFDFTIPFYTGACTTLIAAIIAQILLQEPAKRQPQKNQAGDKKASKRLLQRFNIIRQLHILCRNRSLKWLFISGFCFWFAVDTYYEFYPAYLVKIFGMNAFDIALLTVVMSLGIVFGNLLSRFWARHFADIPIVFWHIILFILILTVTLLTSHLLSLYIVFSLTGIFIAITSNHLNVQISEIANVNQQGEALGMATGLRMLGDAFSQPVFLYSVRLLVLWELP